MVEIKDGDTVILLINGKSYVVAPLKEKSVRFSKKKINLLSLIGKQYGSFYRLESGPNLVPISQPILSEFLSSTEQSQETQEETQPPPSQTESRDNRNLIDNNSAQKLNQQEILQLKNSNPSNLVKKLTENSSTFQDKTAYSQEKYIKKKMNKHSLQIQALYPNGQLLCQCYFQKSPAKSCYLRIDSLSQILTYGNIHWGNGTIVVDESSVGLLLACVLERISGNGKVFNFFTGTQPSLKSSNCLNFNQSHTSQLYHYPFSLIDQILYPSQYQPQCQEKNQRDEKNITNDVMIIDEKEEKEKEEKGKEIKEGEGDGEEEVKKKEPFKNDRQKLIEEQRAQFRDIISVSPVDSLVMVTRSSLQNSFPQLFSLLSLSGSFAVFSPYVEVLSEIYSQLHYQKVAVNLQLNEIWTREQQVLPDRTHPLMSMHGTSGYILSGIKVEPPPEKSNTNEQPKKKQKV